jgi:hypothetical protein
MSRIGSIHTLSQDRLASVAEPVDPPRDGGSARARRCALAREIVTAAAVIIVFVAIMAGATALRLWYFMPGGLHLPG